MKQMKQMLRAALSRGGKIASEASKKILREIYEITPIVVENCERSEQKKLCSNSKAAILRTYSIISSANALNKTKF